MTMLNIYQPKRTYVPAVANRIWNDLIENFLEGDSRLDQADYWVPKTNTAENEKEYVVELLMPGTKKENIKINLEENVLTISSENQKEGEQQQYHFREFGHSYKRSFTLPDDVNIEGISANYADGVLKVNIPKQEKAPKITRQIEIK